MLAMREWMLNKPTVKKQVIIIINACSVILNYGGFVHEKEEYFL